MYKKLYVFILKLNAIMTSISDGQNMFFYHRKPCNDKGNYYKVLHVAVQSIL